ncbi:DeoR/GlpR family DNA-binding transcription regulator [Herbiconiux moechotypicola]|uniref:Lactose phosphotransferase system repressor n=1 Tax=Herbiconiux moechotypicola TaxID=637393 RepID=A0ABP5QKC9_9MICO|nr:DeoR/GlpR family DNA-binding transcription regulator [Herbiconiux moechotypicola]MCS5731695.1 DeoR/GlpR family DNA-binding transcription regulator [Herbiconiux moechotypicola]
MYATERQEQIARMLSETGRVGVLELATQFDVTTETVRRDLDALERDGVLRRVHGGAVHLDRTSTVEQSTADRAVQHSEAKNAIAQRALEVLGDGFQGSVYFDAGTTTAAVADRLGSRLASVGGRAEVVTHSFSLAPALSAAEGVSLSIVGGRVRGVTGAAVGAETVRVISGLRPDVAFLGTNALSAGFGASTPDPEEAAVKIAIVRAARRVVLVVDGSKFERERLVSFAALAEIDVLVTDTPLPAALAEAAREANVDVWLA